MTAFDRLHPRLRQAIVHDLGWRSLRPVQELAVEAILAGDNAVVLAPTAGGKTEASMFPVLSRILSERPRPVAALYLSPVRALLNNQEPRLQRYARMVGLDAFKWHGDVSDRARARFRAEPCHLLMTTPESLEVMFVSRRTDARALFSELSVVVIDEVHAFAGDDRGAHLASLLERLSGLCGRDIQRIGLSATVGNPLRIGQWLQGSSQRATRLVDPPRPPAERRLIVDYCDDVDEAARAAAHLGRGRKSLVFAESRAQAEKVARALSGRGVEVFVHHSSVSRQDRERAEAEFQRGQNTAIVCTSTMELGIDVGDLDQVIQIDAPSSVASFLQRLGRTGRRAGTTATCVFLCLAPEALVQAVALLRLAEQGVVEPVRPAEQALHVLAHQVMASTLEHEGVSRHRILDVVGEAFPFQGLDEARVHELVDTMLAREILHESDGLLSLGRRGEKLYGRRNFFDLYAVFDSPPVLRVLWGKVEVGHVQAHFVHAHQERANEPLCFRLAGRAWEAVRLDWNRAVAHVRPADRGRVPSWLGRPVYLGFALCQAMAEVLRESTAPEGSWLTKSAAAELEDLRRSYDGLVDEAEAVLEDHADGLTWHTFAGGAINRLLAGALEEITGERWTAGNLSVRSKTCGGVSARAAIAELPQRDLEAAAIGTAHDMARGRVSKFQPCLPGEDEDRLLVSTLLDVEGTLRFVARVGSRATRSRRQGPRRLADELHEPPETLAYPRRLPSDVAVLEPRNPIELVADDATLGHVARELEKATRIGLDVETTLDTHAVCLVQLATEGVTYVVDALAVSSLAPLSAVLADPEVTLIIHNASFERRVLGRHDLGLAGVVDTLELSRKVRGRDALGGHSLGVVCERELGRGLDKRMQRSPWSSRPLTDEQLRYAALDAEVLLRLHQRLRAPDS